MDVNVCKTKHLTNTRASGSDDALRLIPISKLSLEGCLEFLAQDELLEVTPENLRIRKQILNHEQRMKAKSKAEIKFSFFYNMRFTVLQRFKTLQDVFFCQK